MPLSPGEQRELRTMYGTYVPTVITRDGSRVPAVLWGRQIGDANAPTPTPAGSSASGMSSAAVQRVLTVSDASADVVDRAFRALPYRSRVINRS